MAQDHLTGGLAVTEERIQRMRASAEQHWEAVTQVLPDADPSELHGYEFGAGWHLGVAVVLAAKGVGMQTLVDRRPLARPDLVRATIRAFATTDLGGTRLRGAEEAVDLDAALRSLGICYRAPCDARSTGLPDASVDFVTSTSTLEHIPECHLEELLGECHRILRPNGVLSALIDYGDHYAHVDPSITSVNFLTYGPAHWRLYSPPLHFQNRLRHGDHLALIEAAGFEIIAQHLTEGDEADLALVTSPRLHAAFRGRDVTDLTIREAHIRARKRGRG
jgi:SAM-dependent methyltransferase